MAKNQTLEPGSKLGPYEVVRLIGKGGMGEVYEAYEPSLDRKVALKIIPKELSEKDAEVIKRFDAEGKVLAQLSHPNVVVVHSLGQSQGIHYLAMEFVDGPSLKQRIKEQIFEVTEALPLFLQMVAGTEALHRNGVIHRDLKPANVIYKKDGSIKIVDLGIAKNMEDTNPEITKIGEVVGSPMYMSPEVACGEPANKQSDIWGLGLIFFEMLVGKNPFKGSSQGAILKKITTVDLDFPKESYVKLPLDLIKIIKKMCSRTPTRRYLSANEVYRDLDALAQKTLKKENLRDTQSLKLMEMAAATAKFENEKTLPLQRTQAVGIRTKVSKHNHDETEDSKLKIYSLVYLVIAAGTVALFFNFKDKILVEPIAPPPVVANNPPAITKQPITLTIKSPKPTEVVWVDKNNLLTVSYSVSGEKSNFRLQIAQDSSFSKITLEKIAPPNPFRTSELEPEKSYYLRFVSGNSVSDIIPFSISAKLPPAPVAPTEGKVFTIPAPNLKEATVNIEWKKKIGVDRYRVQVARDANFRKIVFDKSIAGNVLSDASLVEGKYYWRIRTIGENPTADMWSSAIGFTVQPAAPVPVPTPIIQPPVAAKPPIRPQPKRVQLKTPALNNPKVSALLTIKNASGRLPASYSASNPPTLSWQKVKSASSYAVQISSDPSFISVVVDTSTFKPSFQWRDVVPGQFYWRIYARDSEGTMSSSSVVGKIEALVTGPEIEGSFKLTAKPGDAGRYVTKLGWQKIPVAHGYLIKVSPNSDFKRSVVTYKADTESYDLELDTAVKQYIRVAALGDSGEPVSQFSKPSLLLYQMPKVDLATPKVNIPNDGSSLGYPPGPDTPVVFDWSSIDRANGYQIQISRSKSFSSPLFTGRSKDNRLLLDKKLPAGTLYWRVRSEYNTDLSPWSNPSSFEVPQ